MEWERRKLDLQEHAMATVTDDEALERRLAALCEDPSVVIHRRTATEPFKPVIEATEAADILALIGRGAAEDEEDANA
jgi:hypothetical protein